MAIDANLILNQLQSSLNEVAPATNLLQGITQGQGLLQNQQQLEQGDIRNQLLQQQLATGQAQAPLQQQLLEQRLATGEQALGAAQQTQGLEAQAASLKTLGSAVKTLRPFIEAGDLLGAASQIDILEQQGVDPELLDDIDDLIATGDLDQINQSLATVETLNRASSGEGEIIKSSQRLVNIDGQQFSEVDVALSDGTLDTIRTPVGGGIAKKTTGETISEERKAEILQKGAERSSVLEADLKTAPTVEATKAAAKQAITASGKAFDRLEGVAEGIGQIDDAIRLIDEGADTGIITSKLPSISKASIGLDNLQKRMGLNVVSNTTFGALSAGELNIALSSALPTNLSPPDLKRWLIQKKGAQTKLQNYLSDAASFLGTPGNTIADFVELQKVKELEQDQGVEQTAPQQRERQRGGPTGGNSITLPNGVTVKRVGG